MTLPSLHKDRIQITNPDIVHLFDSLENKILTHSQIKDIVKEHIDFGKSAQLSTVSQFVKFMLKETKLREVDLLFPSSKLKRYTWGDVTPYELALSLRSGSYLTHYTAMYLHDLTEQVPKTIYVNSEQSSKPYQDRSLDQNRIDFAFKNAPRISKCVAKYKNQKICLLYGRPTDQLGVIDTQGRDGGTIRVTDVERTLIDMAVRPFYSGTVYEVLKAYKLAKDKVSINKLAAMLKKMNYIYPYHQSIGFYLEKCGAYRTSQVKIFQKFERNFDFYLTYQMKHKEYSKEWRLFYPKGL